MPRTLRPCGTEAALKRHRERGEKIDPVCRAAGNAASAERKRTPYRRARSMAMLALSHRHPEEFKWLMGRALKEIQADPSLLQAHSPRRPPGPRPGAPGSLAHDVREWIDRQPREVTRRQVLDEFGKRAPDGTICQTLCRLARRGQIERIKNGVYWSAV